MSTFSVIFIHSFDMLIYLTNFHNYFGTSVFLHTENQTALVS